MRENWAISWPRPWWIVALMKKPYTTRYYNLLQIQFHRSFVFWFTFGRNFFLLRLSGVKLAVLFVCLFVCLCQSVKGELNHQLSRSPRRDLFLFPDDELSSPVEEYYPPEETNAELPNPGEVEEEEEDSDDDFCILEHPDKEPEGLSHEVIIKRLIDEQVSIVDNHFTVPVRILWRGCVLCSWTSSFCFALFPRVTLLNCTWGKML